MSQRTVVRTEQLLPNYWFVQRRWRIAIGLGPLLIIGLWAQWPPGVALAVVMILHAEANRRLLVTGAVVRGDEVVLSYFNGRERVLPRQGLSVRTGSPLRVPFFGGVPVYAYGRLVGVFYPTISAQDLVAFRQRLEGG